MTQGTTSAAASRDVGLADAVDKSLARAVDLLYATQRPDGSWLDRLPSSAVATGAVLLALDSHDGQRHAAEVQAGCAWLRKSQAADGGWSDCPGGPGTLNATAIAAGTLASLDHNESRCAIERGLAYIHSHGGFPAIEDRERCTMSAVCLEFLARGGLYSGRSRRIPIEVALIPPRLQRKLSFTLPGAIAWGIMDARQRRRAGTWRGLDAAAEKRALRWLERLQAFDGFLGGFEESPLMAGVVAYGLARAGVRGPVLDRCCKFLLATRRPDGSWPVNRDLEISATLALASGLKATGCATDAGLLPTRDWIMNRQRREGLFVTGTGSGGWAWSSPSGWPNSDDTSCALIALRKLGVAPGDPVIQTGVRFLRRMQGLSGGWACFVRSRRVSLDRPCPVFTAHALEALAAVGTGAKHRAVRRGLRHLSAVQRPDGSLQALWYVGATAGTAAAITAFACFGRSDDDVPRRCVDWLLRNQRADGSWNGGGGDASSVEETSWALAALLAARVPANDSSTRRAAAWLVDRQLPSGGWPPSLVGVYFPSLLYYDDQIATGLVLQSLGRYQSELVRAA